ncbi:MBL fold metallo-hydrolase [Deltaproteobacteria bacterium TL4]
MNPHETSSKLMVKSFPVGPLACNCTILGDPVTKKAVIIDPGGDAEHIMNLIQSMGLEIIKILHTHAHLDHFLASGKIKAATGAPLALNKEDQDLWNGLKMQCSMFGIPYFPVPSPDHWLQHQEEIQIHDHQGVSLHTPGHSPGSMCFHFESQKLLIAGDTLFQGSIGRTDLWGGNYQKIEHSIKKQLYVLDEATHVVTGHGPATTIGNEIRHNMFVRG